MYTSREREREPAFQDTQNATTEAVEFSQPQLVGGNDNVLCLEGTRTWGKNTWGALDTIRNPYKEEFYLLGFYDFSKN